MPFSLVTLNFRLCATWLYKEGLRELPCFKSNKILWEIDGLRKGGGAQFSYVLLNFYLSQTSMFIPEKPLEQRWQQNSALGTSLQLVVSYLVKKKKKKWGEIGRNSAVTHSGFVSLPKRMFIAWPPLALALHVQMTLKASRVRRSSALHSDASYELDSDSPLQTGVLTSVVRR